MVVRCALVLLLALGLARPSRAAEAAPAAKDRMLVIDFGAALGADSQLAKLVQDLVVSRVHAMARYDVVTTSDVTQMLDMEQQRQLVGCDQGSCLADIGGALGARWVVTGSVSLLGGRNMLTLKLADTREAKIDNQLTRELPSDESEIAEAVRLATYELVRVPAPPPEVASPWYQRWWVWGAAGAVVSGVALTYVLTRQQDVPDASLGTVVLDD